ncbi:hypothetical protein BCR34DRAFT_663637 [Clohesyomyces aquaticus]|uniref:BTB domain-containing protein n=1 Tax=Clohesyomyces aquaticus TaxID=1231657 RepID=A0A1Y1ZR37_9PLEO|nr:hypothetical protein BCR34DRAFT_663637 [Clohesyomyces aquaticus]
MVNTGHFLNIEGGVIRVVVGGAEEKKGVHFEVHEELLKRHSAFFRNALCGDWKESKDRTVKLPGDDPEVFALYCQAIYAGHIARPNDNKDPGYLIQWGRLFALAEKLLDTGSKNTIARAIFQNREHLWSNPHEAAEMAYIIYESSPTSCSMRQLVADIAMLRCHQQNPHARGDGVFSAALDDLPKDMLVDMLRRFVAVDPYRRDYGYISIENYLETPSDSSRENS